MRVQRSRCTRSLFAAPRDSNANKLDARPADGRRSRTAAILCEASSDRALIDCQQESVTG